MEIETYSSAYRHLNASDDGIGSEFLLFQIVVVIRVEVKLKVENILLLYLHVFLRFAYRGIENASDL